MKKLYVKKGMTKKLKLNRSSPVKVKPSKSSGGFQAKLKEHMTSRAKEATRKVSKSLIRTIDPYQEEELHSSIESVRLNKKGADHVKKVYKQTKDISHSVKRLHAKVKLVKSKGRNRPLLGYKKIKGAVAPQSFRNFGNGSKIKTLTSRFVPKNRFTSLSSVKTGVKKGITSPVAVVRAAAQQLTKKLAAAAAANPKVWIIGAIVGVIFFLLMSVTNSLGGAASSAGSFFMTDGDNAVQYKDTVNEQNNAFLQEIEDLSHSSGYDDIRVEYMNEDGSLQVNWVEILALVAVHFEQDLTFTESQRSYISYLFEEFTEIDPTTETYYVEVCESFTDSETGESYTSCHNESRRRLIIKVYTYDMEEVFNKISFNEEQKEWARRLVTSGAIEEQFPELGGGEAYEPTSGSLTPEERAALLNNLGGDIGLARESLIEEALTLVGRVPYFWGGKSPSGWNDLWNTSVKVTAPGSDTTGTYQPYGLDCSGFIDWAFKTAGLGNVFSAGGTSYQWSKTSAISADELIPGDLVFKNKPGQGGVNHVGIFIGRDESGGPIYVHCEGGNGVVVNGYKGFKYPRRPLLFQ